MRYLIQTFEDFHNVYSRLVKAGALPSDNITERTIKDWLSLTREDVNEGRYAIGYGVSTPTASYGFQIKRTPGGLVFVTYPPDYVWWYAPVGKLLDWWRGA